MAREESPDIQRADRGERRRALLYLTVAAVVGLVVIGGLEEWLHGLHESAAADPTAAVDEVAAMMRMFGAVVSVSLFGLSLVFARFGFHVYRARRFPPPGLRVTVDTRVMTGTRAQRMAYAVLLVAASLASLAVFAPYVLWRTFTVLATAAH